MLRPARLGARPTLLDEINGFIERYKQWVAEPRFQKSAKFESETNNLIQHFLGRKNRPARAGLVVTEDSIVFLKVAGRTLRGIETRLVEIVEGQADLAGGEVSEGGPEIEFLIGEATAKPKSDLEGKSEARLRKSERGSVQVMIYEGASSI